ncbi:MAG: ribonuclease HII [Bacteroidota bacterium]|nr:ribonuclease HII [Candidatus Kapabacteria bacterium]MDW8219323.1 ribonuclease HII [Bacteroidota bacterium]
MHTLSDYTRASLAIGVDEAGRGALAGPVVAAAVLLSEEFDRAGIQDSKKLTSAERQRLFERIMSAHEQGKVCVGIGFASVDIIEQQNILQATICAMHTALDAAHSAYTILNRVSCKPTVLVDGNYFHSTTYTHYRAIVHGDELVDCIAAASIVAKVTRDRWMQHEADPAFPVYGFKQHKGYGTRQHREAIRHYGTCPLHRSLFVRSTLQQSLFI